MQVLTSLYGVLSWSLSSADEKEGRGLLYHALESNGPLRFYISRFSARNSLEYSV